MSISMEFLLVIVVNVLTAGVFIGGLAMSIKFIEKQIKRLEDKQDKHNCLIERMVKVEESTKSAHHRLDNIEGKKR
ncbi:MAG: hypothetical protein MJ231_06370 [bacterium]|nr:hypothetical protein [bacterium]